ncbi:MAG: type II toxin-antitoxin system VapC family toxin [Terracidiphilus sp.]|jgi:predicted nucleic acid-binding protein
MFLVDTNAISELRKGAKADRGVVNLLKGAEDEIFVPVQVLGELRYGIEKLKHRGDLPQARRLEEWFQSVLKVFGQRILGFDAACAQMWGTLMGVNDQHPVDKQIAAIALVYDLTVVTRNTNDFAGTGVRLLNPFHSAPALATSNPKRKPQ